MSLNSNEPTIFITLFVSFDQKIIISFQNSTINLPSKLPHFKLFSTIQYPTSSQAVKPHVFYICLILTTPFS